jgi:hypothetical protein
MDLHGRTVSAFYRDGKFDRYRTTPHWYLQLLSYEVDNIIVLAARRTIQKSGENEDSSGEQRKQEAQSSAHTLLTCRHGGVCSVLCAMVYCVVFATERTEEEGRGVVSVAG